MSTANAEDLTRKHCTPCEGGIPQLSEKEAGALLAKVEGWEFSHEGQRIRRRWTAKNFLAALDFLNNVGEVAEREGHHPDLHLEAYRQVTVEIWTHAIKGLSENDFILAAKINEVPIALKK